MSETKEAFENNNLVLNQYCSHCGREIRVGDKAFYENEYYHNKCLKFKLTGEKENE